MEKETKMSSEVHVVKGVPEDVKTVDVSVKVMICLFMMKYFYKILMFFFLSLNIDVILYNLLYNSFKFTPNYYNSRKIVFYIFDIKNIEDMAKKDFSSKHAL